MMMVARNRTISQFGDLWDVFDFGFPLSQLNPAMRILTRSVSTRLNMSGLEKVVFEVCSIQFEVSPRYNLEHLIGTGAYGTIW